MTFTTEQTAALRAKLRRRHVKTRTRDGLPRSFLEGWHVIAEANRIFGFDCWDRRTRAPRCIWSGLVDGQTAVFYTTTVQITVRAGGTHIVRDGVGTGFGRAQAAELAHEIALKAAETDATKRALATFGNPFGLALYDKQQKCVTRPPRAPSVQRGQTTQRPQIAEPECTFILHAPDGSNRSFSRERAWLAAAHEVVPRIETLAALYSFWNLNKCAFKQIRLSPLVTADMVEAFIDALKARARALGRSTSPKREAAASGSETLVLIPKEKRLRCKTHLAFVRTLPCLVCGRQPSHAHHVKFAQQGALGMKVSDEYTVPLCFLHHDALHQAGNERAWWEARNIDPLAIASDLWASTRGVLAAEDPEAAALPEPEETETMTCPSTEGASKRAHGALALQRRCRHPSRRQA